MADPLSSSAQRVQDALRRYGMSCAVVEFSATTRSAKDAAAVVGCSVGQIAKSIVFRTVTGRSPVLVIASGANRINEKLIGEIVGEPIELSDADYVREATGFAIGGVPPIGHVTLIRTLIDAELLKFDVIWAAAGSPRAVFQLSPLDLQRMTGGSTVTVR